MLTFLGGIMIGTWIGGIAGFITCALLRAEHEQPARPFDWRQQW